MLISTAPWMKRMNMPSMTAERRTELGYVTFDVPSVTSNLGLIYIYSTCFLGCSRF